MEMANINFWPKANIPYHWEWNDKARRKTQTYPEGDMTRLGNWLNTD
jgi:hypothetical protein